jgi:hypothetical protein
MSIPTPPNRLTHQHDLEVHPVISVYTNDQGDEITIQEIENPNPDNYLVTFVNVAVSNKLTLVGGAPRETQKYHARDEEHLIEQLEQDLTPYATASMC